MSHKGSNQGNLGNKVDSNPSKDGAEEKEKQLLKEALAIKEKGNGFYRKRKYEEAIECYDRAIEKCPTDKRVELAIFYQNRAASYQMLQRWQQVKDDCTKALDNNPRYIKAYARRSNANKQLGHLYECLEDLTATRILESSENKEIANDYFTILAILAKKEAFKILNNKTQELPSAHFIKRYLDDCTTNPLKTADVTHVDSSKGFARAKVALDAAKYEEIVPACTEEIASTEPKFKDEALLLRGAMYTLMLRFQEAEDDFNSVINRVEANPKFRASALIQKARLNFDKVEDELAFAILNQAEKLEPNNPDVFFYRAEFYKALDQFVKALEEYEKTLKLSPDHARTYAQKCYAEYRLALVARDHWRLMSVMIDLKNAVEKYPNCEECYFVMSEALCEQDQFDEANKFLKKGIKVDPQNAMFLCSQGFIYFNSMKDNNKAIDFAEKSIKVDSKCGLAYKMLGAIAMQRGELQKAIEAFEKANKYARTLPELILFCALKIMAVSRLNETKKLGVDVSPIFAVQRHMYIAIVGASN